MARNCLAVGDSGPRERLGFLNGKRRSDTTDPHSETCAAYTRDAGSQDISHLGKALPIVGDARIVKEALLCTNACYQTHNAYEPLSRSVNLPAENRLISPQEIFVWGCTGVQHSSRLVQKS